MIIFIDFDVILELSIIKYIKNHFKLEHNFPAFIIFRITIPEKI